MMSVFHYTRLSTLIDYILPSGKLKANDLNNMNDPRESHAWSFGGMNVPLETLFPGYYTDETHIDCQYRFGKMIKDRFQIICFSGARQQGWNNEMMWAHYAENQRGVCLEFDIDSLTDEIRKIFPAMDWVLEPVNYISASHDSPWIIWNRQLNTEENFKTNVKRIHKDIVLHKSHFWEKEDEIRLVFLNEKKPVLIPIAGCLKAIHLGIGFPRTYLPAIEDLVTSMDIGIYQNIYDNDEYQRWRLKKENGKWRSYADDDQ
ncbi:MAG TPA: DUF2971 domain-containing protein [Mucilaginibacter sp.]|jgi:hypothetical protein|nr:DUF2971 domain-containing protein [Mucilaginibacter sp.]